MDNLGNYGVQKAPKFEAVDLKKVTFSDSLLDGDTLSNINAKSIEIIIALRTLNNALSKYEQELVKAEIAYKKKYRHALTTIEAKNDSQKKLFAEIECEEEENHIMYLKQILEELRRRVFTHRSELEVLRTIGSNVKQEMNMV